MKIELKDISFNLTNFCLASCKHCNLCRQQHLVKLDEELSLKQIEKLFSDPMLNGLSTIHITGGEPSLSPKMYYLAEILKEYHSEVPMNTPISGLYPDLMLRLWSHIHRLLPQFRCDLAIEGPNSIIHEKVRGIGTWEPAMETLRILKAIGVPLQFEMTIYEENYRFIEETYNFSKEKKVGFYLNFGRWSRRFGHLKDEFIIPSKEQQEEIWKQIDSIGWRNWRPLNAQKYELQKAYWGRRNVNFDCLMGLRSIDVDPWGNVFPCLMYPIKMSFGNIKFSTLTEMFQTYRGKEILQRIRDRECQPCPFTCVVWVKNLKVN